MNIVYGKYNFSDVMIMPSSISRVSSRKDVMLLRTFEACHSKQEFTVVPIIASNMATGTFEMLDKFKEYDMMVSIAKFKNDEWNKVNFARNNKVDNAFYTIGLSDTELDKFAISNRISKEFTGKNLKLCLDVANGNLLDFRNFVSKVRAKFPEIVIVAGNVATAEATRSLVLAGADIVKVGIGAGSQCTTRLKTGVGYPQLSAVIECSEAAHALGAYIISDGGIRSSGDMSKAFCAGADFVMIGGLIAGTDECDGKLISKTFRSDEIIIESSPDGQRAEGFDKFITKQYKLFYGMSSEYAQVTHSGEMKEYRASEGNIEEVPYTGSVVDIIKDFLGGIRSTGTYIGANYIGDFPECATFVETSRIHDKF